MSILGPFRYRNDCFPSDIFFSDIGITDADIKIDVDAHLWKLTPPPKKGRLTEQCRCTRAPVSVGAQMEPSYLWSDVSTLQGAGGQPPLHAHPLTLVRQLDVTPPVQQHILRVQVLDDDVPA